jgi:hypothetical protein
MRLALGGMAHYTNIADTIHLTESEESDEWLYQAQKQDMQATGIWRMEESLRVAFFAMT